MLNKMGMEFEEMDLSCCGGGGLLRMTDPDLSDKIIQIRAQKERLGDKVVLTCCPSCREQLLGANLRTRDIVEILADALEEGEK